MSKRKKLPNKPASTPTQAIEMDMNMVTVPKGLIDHLYAAWQASIEFDLAVGRLDEDDPELMEYADKRAQTCANAGIALEAYNIAAKRFAETSVAGVKA